MPNSEFYPLIAPKKDGLLALESDPWILSPIKTLGNYLEVYSYLLSPSYNQLIYIEMNAGTGMVGITNSEERIYDTALLALSSPIEFNRYIFWEPNETYAQALRVRISRNFKSKSILILSNPLEDFLEQLKSYIPINNKGIKPWIFCNINPRFGFPDFKFLDKLQKLDPVLFFTLSGEKKGFWKKIRRSGVDFETEARNYIKDIEEWSADNNFRLKGSFSLSGSSHMEPLYYQGILCRKANVKRVSLEVEKKTSGQFQLF